jgi:8-oxo-dGTP diphosphatase
VVWRRRGGSVEVVMVHRPRYSDWSFPKGKAHGPEPTEAAALREVREETGLACRLGPQLATTRYLDDQGRPKTVRYWAMTLVEAGDPNPGPLPEAWEEVDTACWAPLPEARGRLTYEREHAVLDALEEFLEVGGEQVHDSAEAEPERHQAN